MHTQIVLVHDTRYTKRDGTAPLILRIIHHRASSQIRTGIYVASSDWDDTLRKIKSSYKGTDSVVRLNNLLQKKKAEALDAITALDEQKRLTSMSVIELRDYIARKDTRRSFSSFATLQIQALTAMGKIGNARGYIDALRSLTNFAQGKDIAFHEVTYSYLKRYEAHHTTKGTSANTIATYLKKIRALYNRAIKEGLIDQSSYPFTSMIIKTTKTRKRAISMEAIKRIVDIQLPLGHTLAQARTYFLLSFYLRGMSFSDMAHLKVSNIIDGRIQYQRQKTDKPYSVKITKETSELLAPYLVGKKQNDYILPVIYSTDIETQYDEVVQGRKFYNHQLKALGQLCYIQEHLTSYVSRHSFATRAKNLGVPIATISDMLGHDNIKTTEVYLDSLESDLLDEAHERIIR
jgi:integrase/recombinase XerD